MSYADGEDGELLRRYAVAGCQASFARVVARHAAMVRGVCRRVGAGSGVDADDVAQCVFATLARQAGSLTGHPSVAGWLHRAAWNAASRHRRDAATRGRHERAAGAMRAAAGLGTAANGQAAAGPLDREVLRVEVHRAVNALPDPYHVAVVLHDLQGWSIREVADLVGSPVGTVAAHVSRGRRMVRDRLGRRGIQTASVAVVAALLAAERASEAAAGGTAASSPAPPVGEASAGGLPAAASATVLLSTPACAAAATRWNPPPNPATPTEAPATPARPGGSSAGVATLSVPAMAAATSAYLRPAATGFSHPLALLGGSLLIGCFGFAGVVGYSTRFSTGSFRGDSSATGSGTDQRGSSAVRSGDGVKIVPEPASATLVAAAGLGLIARRPRRPRP